jgi:hypothetical protein
MKRGNLRNSLTKPTISSTLKKKLRPDENTPVKKTTGQAPMPTAKKSPLPFKKLDFNLNRRPSLA